MNRDPRQQAYLNAMGIDVWVRRDTGSAITEVPISEEPVSERPSIVAEEFNGTSLSNTEVSNVKSLNWSDLEQQVVSCQLCELHATRTQAVFGVGNQQADWLIIGEAPGADEDRQGEPFVGRVKNARKKISYRWRYTRIGTLRGNRAGDKSPDA